MKKIISIIVLLSLTGMVFAQNPQKGGRFPHAQKQLPAERKFQILVSNENNEEVIHECNDRLLSLQERSLGNRSLLESLWKSATSSLKQKTVNASSNLLSLGINYLSELVKSDREEWYSKAQQQCYYNQKLSAETKIDDFYALPSTKGAMDPENMKFEGFGCKNYIEVIDSTRRGRNIFYIFCKMRRDEEGLNHIINHSKFLVDIDTLFVDPQYCNLPNDSTGRADSRFSFEKRDNLNLTLKVYIYSTWMNQATMITNDKLLGEFTVHAKIDKKRLNAKGQFIYDKNNPDYKDLVSVDGDCFIVPRSFTGTNDAKNYQPVWGTGQYRIEMEVSESCRIVDSYYQIKEAGNGEAVAFADATPGKKKWDKAKWKTEWKVMNARKKGDSFWKNAWNCIITGYKGSGWMATLTDPIATSLYEYEIQKLDDLTNSIHESLFTKSTGASTSNTNTPTSTGVLQISNPQNKGGKERPQKGATNQK